MAIFKRTGSAPRSTAIVGKAVVTTVESSICISRAQPTIKGSIRSGLAGFGGGAQAFSGWLNPGGVIDILAVLAAGEGVKST